LFELAVVIGVIVALVRRVDVLALSELRFRGLWFCIPAFAIKVLLLALGAGGNPFIVAYGMWLDLAVMLILLGLVAANLHLPGMPVLLVGLFANLLVIGLNGGRMPVTMPALAATNQPALVAVIEANEDPGHALANPNTRLTWLADWIPLNPLNRNVFSPGDVLAALGLAITVGFAAPSRHRSALARRADVR
jgi:hypothetical protein